MGTHFAKPHLTNCQLLHICTWAQNTEEGGEAKPHSWLGCTEATTILKGSLVGTVNVTLCLVTQSCATLCYPMDCSPPGSSVQGIFQARILEWVAISFSRGSSQLRDGTQVSFIVDTRFTISLSKSSLDERSKWIFCLQAKLGKA